MIFRESSSQGYVLVSNGCKLWRDTSGKICPDLGNIEVDEKSSKEYEVSIAGRILYDSAVANEYDASELAEEFWAEFIQPLQRGEQLFLRDYELKKWVNQFAIHTEPTERYKNRKPGSFHAVPPDA